MSFMVTAASAASASSAAERDLKTTSATTKGAANSKPIDSVINDIASAVRAQDLETAKNLIQEKMKDNPLRKRVEEIVFLPFHMYIRHNFKLLCTYKSLRLQALAGDTKAQETLDSWHAINSIFYVLDFRGTFENISICNNVEINFDGEIPIFYLNCGPHIKVTPTKTETGLGDSISFKVDFLKNPRDPIHYKFKASSNTKFLLFFEDAAHHARVIEGKIVDKELEVIPYRFISGDHDFNSFSEDVPSGFDPKLVDDVPQIERDDELAAEITSEQLKRIPTDFSQIRINNIMQYVKNHFHVYRHPKSGISIFTSPKSPAEEILKVNPSDFLRENFESLAVDPNENQQHSFLGWTAEGQCLHTINSYNNKQVTLPFDSNEITCIFDRKKSTCTLVAKSKTLVSKDLFSMEYTRVDWETAAIVTMRALGHGIDLESRLLLYTLSVESTSDSNFTIFSHDGNLYLENSKAEANNNRLTNSLFRIFMQHNGVWDSVAESEQKLTVQSTFETDYGNGIRVRRPAHFVQKFIGYTPNKVFPGYENYTSYGIQIPPSTDFRPFDAIPFDFNSEEDQEKYGVRRFEAYDSTFLEFRKLSPLDVLRAEYLKENYPTLFDPCPMLKDVVILISQFVSFFPQPKK